MKRLVATVGLGLGIAALAAGPAMAACHDPKDDYPESEGYSFVDNTEDIPAGYACDTAVRLRVTGHERTLLDGKPITRDPQAGDRLVGQSPDEVATLTNLSNGRSITKKIDGTFYLRILANGEDAKLRGVGRNLYHGAGVNGVLWTDGVQLANAFGFKTEDQIEIVKIKGKAVDLCTKVGARPVPGKHLPEGQ